MHTLRHNLLLAATIMLALLCVGIWSAVYAEEPQGSGQLTFAMLDVGQGDALYIESPTGVQVLVDAGPGSAVLRELAMVMPPLDRTLDAIVETHPDADHVGGFAALLERYAVGVYLTPGIPKDTAVVRALLGEVDAQDISTLQARRGMVLDLGGGAFLRVLYPEGDVAHLSARANDGGVVMQLIYGETEALLMGDVPVWVENRLMQLEGAALQSDLLKVGHHGSRTSTGFGFVGLVAPQRALVSSGANNSYGHPTPEVLSTLERHGAEVLRTDQNGTIVCVSDGAVFTCE